MSCGVGHRCDSDPMLLWWWCRPAAEALIRPLARELPYTVGVALKKTKDKTKTKTAKNDFLWQHMRNKYALYMIGTKCNKI